MKNAVEDFIEIYEQEGNANNNKHQAPRTQNRKWFQIDFIKKNAFELNKLNEQHYNIATPNLDAMEIIVNKSNFRINQIY